MDSNNDYLKFYFKISAVLSLIYLTIYWLFFYHNDDFSYILMLILIFIIPIITSGLIMFIGRITKENHPKITKIIANLINVPILIIHFCCVSLMLLAFWAFSDMVNDAEYTDINDYPKAIKAYIPEAVEHFPNEIPKNASNISMLKTPSSFTGDSEFYLKFDTDKNYIDSQKNLFKYNKKFNNEYDINRANNVLNSIIGDTKGWEIITIESSSCYRGVAFKNNSIIYTLYCD